MWAAHPYVTDDSGTQGAGNWQLELLAERVRHDRTANTAGAAAHQHRKVIAFNPVLTYGLREDLDIALGANHLRDRVREDGALTASATGAGDSTLELKWRFYEANGLSLALKPGLILPTGDENRGLGTGRLSFGLNAILTYEAKPWVWLANLAHTHARYRLPQDARANRRHLWRASGGFGYFLREDLRLVGEAGARTNPAKDDPFLPGRNGHFAMLGLIYSPSGQLDLDVGLRRSMNSGEADRALLLGATFRW
ncbi:MAG TPA: transporter [Burkholderiales bacterium]|nr:transporter [Burkholderiales bacterium]